ncbi:MAG: hypothetical protein IPK20_25725 [Betaproteobacteria bacterium]|nr:hypothetical protein [Betaproteobacteria bacterium]
MAESGAMATLLELRSVAVNSFRVAGTAAALQTLVDRSVNAASDGRPAGRPSPDVWLHYVDGTVESGPRWPDASCRCCSWPSRSAGSRTDRMRCTAPMSSSTATARFCPASARISAIRPGRKIDVTHAAGRTRIVVRTDVYGGPATRRPTSTRRS